MPTYVTVDQVKDEAKLQDYDFAANEVEDTIDEVEALVNNFTDRLGNPWVNTEAEYPIIVQATRIGSAGFLLQKFGSGRAMEDGKTKIDMMYSVLRNIVYGEGGSGDDGSGGGMKGDIFVNAGSFEFAEFEEVIHADVNQDNAIGY